MKIEIELKTECINVNGFDIYSEPKHNDKDEWINYEIYWKDSRVCSFENLSEAIKYCQND